MISILKVNEGKKQLMNKVLKGYACIGLNSKLLKEVESVVGHIIFYSIYLLYMSIFCLCNIHNF